MKSKPKNAKVTAHVIQGSCHVNNATMRQLGPKVQHWIFDLKAKYAEVTCTGGSGKQVEILVGKNRQTLHFEPNKDDTSVWLDVPNGWELLSARVSRYTLTIIIAKEKGAPWINKVVWQHTDYHDKKPVSTCDALDDAECAH